MSTSNQSETEVADIVCHGGLRFPWPTLIIPDDEDTDPDGE